MTSWRLPDSIIFRGMIRQIISKKNPDRTSLFRERGSEIYRIEGFTDAVFAFSISLLVAALEVPQTYDELWLIIQGSIPFFCTVAVLFIFWFQQYRFFRNYGLNDTRTILLNFVFIAVLVFYIYPMKFLFSLLLSMFTGIDLFPKAKEHGEEILQIHDFPQLIILFSIGYFLLWLLIYLMHLHAWKMKEKLELNFAETARLKSEMWGALLDSTIGILSLTLATLGLEREAGLCFLFIPVKLVISQLLLDKKLKMPSGSVADR
jgi:uncharacterized membrane protein